MTTGLLRRLLALVVVLLGLSLTVFVLQEVSPIDPVRATVGASAPQSVVDAERARLGLDDPAVVRYLRYLGDIVRGDLQKSLRTHQPVRDDLARFLPATIELSLFGLALAAVLALAFGILGSRRGATSQITRFWMIAGAAAPVFLLAIAGKLLFYKQWGLLPAGGRGSVTNPPNGPTGLRTLDGLLNGRLDVTTDALRHLVLPGFCVALSPAVAVGRVLRGGLVDFSNSDAARTARSLGLTERAITLRHGLRNAAAPALAMGGLQVGLTVAGIIVVETLFAWPGVGFYLSQSLPDGDFPAIAGVTLLFGTVYVVANFLAETLQTLVDPRLSQ